MSVFMIGFLMCSQFSDSQVNTTNTSLYGFNHVIWKKVAVNLLLICILMYKISWDNWETNMTKENNLWQEVTMSSDPICMNYACLWLANSFWVKWLGPDIWCHRAMNKEMRGCTAVWKEGREVKLLSVWQCLSLCTTSNSYPRTRSQLLRRQLLTHIQDKSTDLILRSTLVLWELQLLCLLPRMRNMTNWRWESKKIVCLQTLALNALGFK